MVREFKSTDLRDLVYEEEPEGFTLVEETLVDTGRWSAKHELVFSFSDESGTEFYKVGYSRGLTEHQDEQPFEHDGDYVPCVPVKLVQKTVDVWEEI